MEPHKKDIDFLVTSAHDEYSASRSKAPNTTKPVKASDSLLEMLRLLFPLLEDMESDREKWWTSPQKRERRKKLEPECDQKELSELHNINNEVTESIEVMNGRLGTFVKWSLGMNGGVWELVACANEVASASKPVEVD